MSFSGISSSYILILFLSCVEYWFHYRFICYIRKDLTTKQKAYILSLKSSLTLLLIGIYFNYYYFASGFNEENFYNILETKNGLNFGILVVLYFTAYLIMDVYIGRTEYPEYMKVLSGNFHHIVYTFVNIASLYMGVYPLYLLMMLSEIPTFILALGSFDSQFRNDQLFGITFLLTRIVYHIILTWTFRKHSMYLYLSLAALGLHLYWFYGWVKKYGISTLYSPKQASACKDWRGNAPERLCKDKKGKINKKVKKHDKHDKIKKKSI
jgi:hypothetical protein